jgi:hypothetical protein
MSLASRILFAGSMLACAALCCWAAVSFGGPAATLMWGLAGVCTLIAVVVWLIKPAKELENVRVEGAREPTFRLSRYGPGVKGEIWQLVLGKTQCRLIRPDGTPATAFDRKWAETAIRMPGFVSGDMLAIVKEDWSPPDEEHPFAHDLAQAARSIQHMSGHARILSDHDEGFYWFSPSKELIQAIEEYKKLTFSALGSEASGPLLIKARQCVLSGLVGLAAGIALFVYRFMNGPAPAAIPGNRDARALAIAGMLTLFGVWRIGQGIVHYNKAVRFASETAMGPRVD